MKASFFEGPLMEVDFMRKMLEEIPFRIYPEKFFYAEMPFGESKGDCPEEIRNTIAFYPNEGKIDSVFFEKSEKGSLWVRENRRSEGNMVIEWTRKSGTPKVIPVIIHFHSKEIVMAKWAELAANGICPLCKTSSRVRKNLSGDGKFYCYECLGTFG